MQAGRRALALALLLIALGVGFWRGASNLQGHVQAGAQTIVEALLTQARKGAAAPQAPALTNGGSDAEALTQVLKLLPGLGEPTPVRLSEASGAVGRSLAELNLRGLTGASVLAIARGQEGLLGPTAKEVLRAGDTLALAGSRDAIAAAKELLELTAAPAHLAD